MSSWNTLQVCKSDLQLAPTLNGGQSFRWKNVGADKWIGVFKQRVWILLQKEDCILYQCIDKKTTDEKKSEDICPFSINEKTDNILKSYFRLDVDLNYYYNVWSKNDPYFKKSTPKFYGIRILNQDVVENLFSFICSSNNNIKRISLMIEKLCNNYGEAITKIDNQTYFSFPSVEKLSESNVESDLRKIGFGYRAKYIYQSACKIKKFGGSSWLENLKTLPYTVAKNELMKLPGIGSKVADCICLMSLGHMEAVPVDTHIFQVATSVYLPHLKKHKNLNAKVYSEIADYFRLLHGNYAGWANTVFAKRDSSEEKYGPMVPILLYPNADSQSNIMGFAGGKILKRKPSHCPKGRPFQAQSSVGSQFPKLPSFQSGSMMQKPSFFKPQGNQRPFSQNPFSGFSDMNDQQYPKKVSVYPEKNQISYYPSKPSHLSSYQYPEISQISGDSQYPFGTTFLINP